MAYFPNDGESCKIDYFETKDYETGGTIRMCIPCEEGFENKFPSTINSCYEKEQPDIPIEDITTSASIGESTTPIPAATSSMPIWQWALIILVAIFAFVVLTSLIRFLAKKLWIHLERSKNKDQDVENAGDGHNDRQEEEILMGDMGDHNAND